MHRLGQFKKKVFKLIQSMTIINMKIIKLKSQNYINSKKQEHVFKK